ncbi:MAG: hypothetical protein IT223_02645 [Crocinitomicaceae bacterium]|nr:hypothetical protein [Crocinitomicaceae bacterium]
MLAAALPGAGQIYNKKYWKLPILYAGFGVCTYFIADNTKNYHEWKNAYVASADGNPTTVPSIDPLKYNLNKGQELYHRWLDISYMCLAGVYILQIIDANVDAHLFYYDVSRNLSMNIHPSLISTGQISAGIGIEFHF